MPNNAELIDTLVDKVSGLFSGNADDNPIKEDLQRNLRAVLQNAISKLDMVSREEFDAQVAVLTRSREKIEALETQLNDLAEQLKN